MKIHFVNNKKGFPIGGGCALQDSLAFIEESLQEIGLGAKLTMRTLLLAEELIQQLIEHAEESGELRVQVRRRLGDISVSIRAPGERFDPFANPAGNPDAVGELADEEAQQAIRSILLKSQGDKLSVSHKNGVNHIRILADRANQTMLTQTVFAIVLGLLCGLLMKSVLPAGLSDGLGTYVLSPIQTLFMNALKIVIGPVVFFSIATSIAQFKDLSELGRIGAKVMGMYMLTTVFAVLLGLGIFSLFHPGMPGFALTQAGQIEAVSVDTNVDTSLMHTILNIVPSNIVKPFLEADTLQIIFLAVLCGAAVGMIGEYAAVLQDFFEACNSLFMTITTLIARLIPLVVFCSVALMTAQMSGRSMGYVLGMTATETCAILGMIFVYALLLMIMGRVNPIIFFKKNREGMLTSLTLSSSSAAMPTNMRICTDKLGISPKVCSFSIPLGATINMDGTCIFLTISGLFLARAYNVTVPASAMVSLAVTIILLSLGCPGVPGVSVVCLGVVLSSLGVPVEAVGLVVAVQPFLDMIQTMSNTTGDVTASLIVARSEGLLDLEVYNNTDL